MPDPAIRIPAATADAGRRSVEADGDAASDALRGPETWSRLLHREPRRLTALALLHADSPEEAEDLLAEVLGTLVRRPRRARDPIAYLARALRHAAIARHRRRGAQRRALEVRGELACAGADEAAGAHERAPGDRRRLLEALDRLDDPRREVVLLHARADLSFAQIAECLGLSRNTVASHHRRGIATLRRLLSEDSIHD